MSNPKAYFKVTIGTFVLLSGCAFGLLSGCAVGPRYMRPEPQAAVPMEYKDAGDWEAAAPGDELPKGAWWEVFHDLQLNSLEEQASVSNQNLKAARARFFQARALVEQSQSAQLPVARVGASITGVHQSENRPGSHSSYTDYMFPLDLSYEADVWGRVQYTVDQSRASEQATSADLETINLSMHAELAQDYFAFRGLDAEKQLLDSTVVSYEKALELTQNRFDGGIASQADVAKAETQLESVRAQAIDVTVQRAQLEHAIAALIGKSAANFSLSPAPLTAAPPRIPTGMPSQLLQRRPDIAAAERRVAAANAQIGVSRTAFYPVLSIVAPTGLESGSFSRWLSVPSALFSLGPSALLTAFDGGRRRAVSAQMQSAYDQSVAVYQQAILSAFQEVENSLAAVRILENEADVQDQAVAAAEHSLAVSMNRYQGGASGYLEVTTAQSIALANERTAVQLLARRTIASVQLVKALGGGWDISYLPSN